MYTCRCDTDLKVGGLSARQPHEDVDVASHEGLGEVNSLLSVRVDAERRHRHRRVLQNAQSRKRGFAKAVPLFAEHNIPFPSTESHSSSIRSSNSHFVFEVLNYEIE